MLERQSKSSSGGQSDEELRRELARAVAVAEEVIGTATLPLPFPVADVTDGEFETDADAELEEASEMVN